MTKRVCLEPGCPALTHTSRCERHTREREQARGTRQQRGYDADHDKLRAEWQRRLDQGETVLCWRCLTQGRRTPIDPTAWDLGHEDGDKTVHKGPECWACNRATSGRI